MSLSKNIRWRIRHTPVSTEKVPGVRILINRNVKMTDGKMAAQAVHAALNAFGIAHGRVVVLRGSRTQVEAMPVTIRDAGQTELVVGTLTAGCELEE